MTLKQIPLAAFAKLCVGITSVAAALTVALPAWTQTAVLNAQYANSQINVRSEPTTRSYSPYSGRSGDRIQVLNQARGYDDGFTWYYVRLNNSSQQGWVRSDLVRLLSSTTPVASAPSPSSLPTQVSMATPPAGVSNRVTAIAPSAAQAVAVRSVVNAPQAIEPQARIEPSQPLYTSEQIDYFFAIATGSEFGNAQAVIRKWNGPVRIKVHGSPNSEDLQTLRAVVDDINGLVQGIQLQIVTENPNVDMYFVPEREFSRYEPNYRPVNYGFFWTWWNRSNIIERARILVTTTGVTQRERSHLIREELTQSLGLMQDSHRYPDSIFYQGWTDTTEFSPIDRAIIAMLYRSEIRPGMTQLQVRQAFNQINNSVIVADR